MNAKTHLKSIWKTVLFVFLIGAGFTKWSEASIPNLDYRYAYRPQPIVEKALKHKAQETAVPVYFRKGGFSDVDTENKALFDSNIRGMADKTDIHLSDSSTIGLIMRPRFNIGYTLRFK